MTARPRGAGDLGPAAAPTGRGRPVEPTNRFEPFPREGLERSIPARFAEMVRRYPDRPAAQDADGALTYAALDRTANRAAHALLAHRSGGEPVGLLFEHGAAMIVAILGVLKAGRACVPLDPGDPAARLESVLGDAGCELLLTNSTNLPLARRLLPEGDRILTLDALHGNLPLDDPGVALTSDGLAYLFYTSGSTGRPKAVMQTHRTILHNVMVSTNHQHLCPDDRLSLLPPFAFVASLPDIFGALLNGAAVFPFDVRAEGPGRVPGWLRAQAITVWHTVPTLFRLVARAVRATETFPALRLLYLSSEPLYWRDVEAFRRTLPHRCLLRHVLGTTEISPVCDSLLDATTPVGVGRVPVGHPVADTEIMILDGEGHPASPGGTGEIAIRSPFLTPGYWRRPDLTQDRFLPDPEGGDARVYRTGDVGRLLPDGALLHLGRTDDRGKIGGRTVDPGEIEAAIAEEVEGIKEAVVLLREDRPGDARLVAYLVPLTPPGPSVSVLRQALARSLPGYLIPSAVVMLDALPLTRNGKVDRQALPPPERGRLELDAAHEAPRTPLEERLAAIWAQVLCLDCVGVHDNFLALGGNSLSASQILARAQSVLGVDLSLRSLFEAPTVAGMAIHVARRVAEEGGTAAGRLLADVEGIPDEEAERLLAGEPAPGHGSEGPS